MTSPVTVVLYCLLEEDCFKRNNAFMSCMNIYSLNLPCFPSELRSKMDGILVAIVSWQICFVWALCMAVSIDGQESWSSSCLGHSVSEQKNQTSNPSALPWPWSLYHAFPCRNITSLDLLIFQLHPFLSLYEELNPVVTILPQLQLFVWLQINTRAPEMIWAHIHALLKTCQRKVDFKTRKR